MNIIISVYFREKGSYTSAKWSKGTLSIQLKIVHFINDDIINEYVGNVETTQKCPLRIYWQHKDNSKVSILSIMKSSSTNMSATYVERKMI